MPYKEPHKRAIEFLRARGHEFGDSDSRFIVMDGTQMLVADLVDAARQRYGEQWIAAENTFLAEHLDGE